MFIYRNKVLCDIKLETEYDGGVISDHKMVVASASPYFQVMFAHFAEKNEDIKRYYRYKTVRVYHFTTLRRFYLFRENHGHRK